MVWCEGRMRVEDRRLHMDGVLSGQDAITRRLWCGTAIGVRGNSVRNRHATEDRRRATRIPCLAPRIRD